MSDTTAQDIIDSCEVWDMTLPWLPQYQDIEILARFKRCGYSFVSATLQDWPPTLTGMGECIERFKGEIANLEWVTLATGVHEINRGTERGKLVVGLNSQDSSPIGQDLAGVRVMHEIGVRHMVLAYNVRNHVADGCAEPSDAGLSLFGRTLVREMNHVGILVDCSHTGRRSSLEAIELSERPTIFSHSGAHAVSRHIRNITDEQIRACAAKGGVIGVVGIGAFLGDPAARADSVFRHIDHMASLVGPGHVGLGTDYVKDMSAVWEALRSQKDGAWRDPSGTQLYEGDCFQPEQLTELVELMLIHGYPRESIALILGANFARVYATLAS